MKKIIIYFVLAGLTFSCNSDDNEIATIMGKWFIKGGTSNGGEFQNYNHDCETSRDFQEFFENDEVTFNGYNSACELHEVATSIWVLDGNILTVSNTQFDPMIYEYTYVVESLTDDELILKQTVNEPEGIVVYVTTYTRD